LIWIQISKNLDSQLYQCLSKTLVGGYCILLWSDAVAQCSSDSNCGGLAFTTNHNWHNAYDGSNQPAVELYGTGDSSAQVNGEWFLFPKKCWNFNT
jgi:hypothetical protein